MEPGPILFVNLKPTDSIPTIWYAIDICVTVESILLVKKQDVVVVLCRHSNCSLETMYEYGEVLVLG